MPVSTYMRNIETSPWMNDPKLRIIEQGQGSGGQRSSTFQLDLVQVVPKEECAMNMQELNELDLSNIGDWPAVVKAGCWS